MSGATPTARLLINPAAGPDRQRRRRLDRLSELGRRCGAAVEVTASADDLGRRARLAAEEGTERLLVAGGDGSVHHAIQGLAGGATALGVIPAGTGNDFASAIGVPDDLEVAVRHAVEAPIGRVDLGRVRPAVAVAGVDRVAPSPGDDRVGVAVEPQPPAPGDDVTGGWVWFSTYTGVGFDGEVARRAHQSHRFLSGNAIYVWAVLRTLVAFQPPRLTIEHDGGRFDGRAMFVTVANGPAFGGGMRVAPAARNDDGVLDLVIVRAIPRRTLLAVFPKVYAGRHVGHPAVEILPTRRVTIALDRETTAYADGEPVLTAREEGIDVEVVPGALAVCGAVG